MTRCIVNGTIGRFEGNAVVTETKIQFISKPDSGDTSHNMPQGVDAEIKSNTIVEIPFAKIGGRYRGVQGLPR